MTAPFELPDTVEMWNAAETELLHENIPARVVPCMQHFFQVWGSGTNTQVVFWSHWVDVDDFGNVWDGVERIAACHYALEYDFGPIIILNWGGWLLKLRVQYVELRYTSTDRYYLRLWCSRLSQENIS